MSVISLVTVAALVMVWVIVGLIYVGEVRRARRTGTLEVKFWVAGLLLGFPTILLLSLRWAWLVVTGTVERVLNHRI